MKKTPSHPAHDSRASILSWLAGEVDGVRSESGAVAERLHFMHAQLSSLGKIWDNEVDDAWNDF